MIATEKNFTADLITWSSFVLLCIVKIVFLLIFKGKRKLIYACCLFVFTRSVSLQQSSCPLKGGQIPWKNPCGGQFSNEAPTEVPSTISNDKEWLRNLYVVLMELNYNFTALKALYVSILFSNEYLRGILNEDASNQRRI